jgi:hypothetical protein
MYSKYKCDILDRRDSEQIKRLIVQGALNTDDNFFHKRRNTLSKTISYDSDEKDPIEEARERKNNRRNVLSMRSNARMATWLAQTDNNRLLNCKQVKLLNL